MSAKTFDQAKWIWCNNAPGADEYGEFYTAFEWHGESATLSISADSDYAAYLNGTLCAFGQYRSYPYDKVYDTVDITSLCQKGKNHLAVLVWYYGESNMTYYPGKAGLLFQINAAGQCLVASNTTVRSRMSPTYSNHRQKKITSQMGFGFAYDATREDDWMQGSGESFVPAVLVPQQPPLRPRPCQKLRIEPPRPGVWIKHTDEHTDLYDLGTNTVGLLQLTAISPCEQTLVIAYGEHIADGRVRRLIGKRDFSVEIRVKAGETVYLNPFRRLGCRYLEVSAEAPLTACRIEILPTVYPLRELPPPPLSQAEQEIYDICVNTLRLCMHEHYEDCPWREQALYCMDSRNQMLCGYYAFGETAFPRANLELIAGDRRPDGLLSICSPTDTTLCIPSFSLHYFTECAEYLRYSGDTAFLREIYPKLERILQAFLNRRPASGVLLPFAGEGYWNFYEWQKGLDGHKSIDLSVPDLPLNALFSLALQQMAEIATALGIPNTYAACAADLNQAILCCFWDEKRQLFSDRPTADPTYSVLSNALAVRCGAATESRVGDICAKLVQDTTLTPVSLSMQCFLFDALLATDPHQYRPYILQKIEQTYRPMVECGLGTVWETEQGEADFGGAGSLCHGWSAMPIYYYHILK